MKNAIYFFLFNLFLILVYFYANSGIVSTKSKISYSLPEQKVSNLNHTIILKDNVINISAKRLLKNQDGSFIDEPQGFYTQKNYKISFSAKKGVYREDNIVILKDDGKIITDNNQVLSDELIYDFQNEKIISKDNTEILIDGIKIVGLNFQYDLKKKKLTAEKIKGQI
ncbi:MAG: LPS export ABC transporter periplasmic protein LptC [Proteobacteria bacterium]|nr:LPS export ABC transporter periplasmic protein LptC [Pseudomonadota bacterium]